MKMNTKALLAAAGVATVALSSAAFATEGGDLATKPGAFIGSSAGVPPPGIYSFEQVFTYNPTIIGPGSASAAASGARPTGVQFNVATQGFLFVPGWTFLGATYDAVIVQPFVDANAGMPLGAGAQQGGAFNTYIVPVELSWKLGNSGFAVKTGVGIYLDDGTQTNKLSGGNGLGGPANPYWTYQPELILSYLANGWNISAALYEEFNTKNDVSHYQTGDIFHADFTLTKTIGKWTFGPVAYYVAQVTNDSCDAACVNFYGNPATNPTLSHSSRFSEWAAGGLLGYNFGPASVSIWATQEFNAKASNAAAGASDPSIWFQGTTVFAQLTYQIWAPDAPVQPAMYHK
jgi:hypothetical protein